MGRLKATHALIRVTLYGSLAATGQGHLTAQTRRDCLSPRAPGGRPIEAWRADSVGVGNIEDYHGPVARIDPAYVRVDYSLSMSAFSRNWTRAAILGTYMRVSAGSLSWMSSKVRPPFSRRFLETRPSPQL